MLYKRPRRQKAPEFQFVNPSSASEVYTTFVGLGAVISQEPTTQPLKPTDAARPFFQFLASRCVHDVCLVVQQALHNTATCVDGLQLTHTLAGCLLVLQWSSQAPTAMSHVGAAIRCSCTPRYVWFQAPMHACMCNNSPCGDWLTLPPVCVFDCAARGEPSPLCALRAPYTSASGSK